MKNELLIFGEIPFDQSAPNSPLRIRTKLNSMDFSSDPTLLVRINSEGGDVDNGFAIYNMLRDLATEQNVTITTQIDGRCASIATVILMAGDKRIGNQYFAPFVHSAFASGEINQYNALEYAAELKQIDGRIAQLYSEVTKKPKSLFVDFMKTEKSITTAEALELNFLHEIKKIKNPKNMTFLNKIKNILSPLFEVKNFKMYTATSELLETENDNPAIAVGDKATIDGAVAKGEILMENGQIFVFDDNGVLLEIKEAAAEDPAPENKETDEQKSITEIANSVAKLGEEIAAIKNTVTEVGEIKTSVEEISNKMVAANKVIESIKNLKAPSVTDPKTDEPVSALDKYRK